MDDRFIGYRGSQENEWSWEAEGAGGPSRNRIRGTRNPALAVLSAFALGVVVAGVVYLIAGGGGADDGPAVFATATPTIRPTALSNVQPTNTPGASAVPEPPAQDTALFAWNAREGKWQQDSLIPGKTDYTEGDTVPFLFRLWNVNPGQVYDVAVDYFDCGLSPARSFDYLGSVGDTAPRLAAPGPGRDRPDSQVPLPAAVQAPGGTAYVSVWGGTFQQAPEMSPIAETCTGDQRILLRVLAGSSAIYIEWGAHLASVADWPEDGAASARAPFGMTAALDGTSARRLQVLPNTISR
ncbi:MAG TPA: hypothetical protein VFP63_05565 [Dehalococcoidia bacterium]|nr:hypothetical protein [Dehalococcoidia bacterium]